MAYPTRPLMLAAALAAALSTTPAFAEWRTVEVRTSDLDLSQAAGQQELEVRINRAVRNVCRSRVERNLAERMDIAKCEANARAGAEAAATQRIAAYKAKRKGIASAQTKLAAD